MKSAPLLTNDLHNRLVEVYGLDAKDALSKSPCKCDREMHFYNELFLHVRSIPSTKNAATEIAPKAIITGWVNYAATIDI